MDVANTEQALKEMRGLISSMQQEIAAAVEEKKRRDEQEKKQKQEELLKKQQAEAQTPAPAQPAGVKQQKGGWLGFLFSPHSPFLFMLCFTVLPDAILESYSCDSTTSLTF